MKTFKFLNNKIERDWSSTGLLTDAVNQVLLSDVLNKTCEFINTNNISIDGPVPHMLIVIMTRLFRDKTSVSSYMGDVINIKLNEAVQLMESPSIKSYIDDIQANAWTTVDVEAELIHIISERCNWIES